MMNKKAQESVQPMPALGSIVWIIMGLLVLVLIIAMIALNFPQLLKNIF